MKHECAIYGAVGINDWRTDSEIAQIICLGLEAQQHRYIRNIGMLLKHNVLFFIRGQESCGIVTSEGNNNFHVHKGMGLVRNVFNNENITKLKGNIGIGHTRYSTKSTSEMNSCQPFIVHSLYGTIAVAHNGELINCDSLRKMVCRKVARGLKVVLTLFLRKVYERGVGLSTDSDSELITQALCLIPPDGEVDGPNWPARIKHLMELSPLSYSIVIMLKDRIYAVRDTYGNRPLCLGKTIPLHGN